MTLCKRTLPLFLSAVVWSCVDVQPEPPGGTGTPQEAQVGAAESDSALVPVTSCDGLTQLLQERAIVAMRSELARVRATYLTRPPCGRVDAGVLRPSPRPPSAVSAGGSAGGTTTRAVDLSSPRPSPSAPGSAPGSVSGTNNQVVGVDEADMVKTHDGLLYVLSNGALHVIDAWPATAAHTLARVPLKGTPRQLLLEGGRALVYSAIGAAKRPCTYGYECDFTGDGSKTHVTVLDLRDPAAPRVVRELDLSGSLIAARRIGPTVHTVVSDLEQTLPLRYAPTLARACNQDVDPQLLDEAIAKLDADNVKIIRSADLAKLAPQVSDSVAQPAAARDCRGYHVPSAGTGASFTSVLSLDMTREAPPTRTTIVGRPGAVYVSEDGLYVAARADLVHSARETSVIHKFRVGSEPALTRYEASGVVAGHALNQFAMDEWQGHLRIATTSGRVPDPATHSTFSVLAQKARKLEVVGAVGQIAPTEDIRSVRFAGPRGYVVTFKKTDPLFVIDLADPRAPKVLGELKIPGFSTYMQPLDDDNLLTIGYDADDQGSFAYFQGILLQIFDVRDPTQPRLRHKHVIGTRGSSSEALTNHLAFNYFADRKLLGVPMTICDGGQAGSFGTRMTFSGLMLFDVDLTSGIAERGRVAHPPLTTGVYNDASCSNWWTDATSTVKRSVFMDDYVYSIAEDVVRVQALSALGQDVASVRLAPAGPALR